MLISLNWLKQYVDIKEDIKELENALTMIGQEVEAIDIQGKDLDHVVIGEIVSYDKHPNSDKLTLLKVNVGGAGYYFKVVKSKDDNLDEFEDYDVSNDDYFSESEETTEDSAEDEEDTEER